MAGKPKNAVRFTPQWVDSVTADKRTFYTDKDVPALKLRVDGAGRKYLTWGRVQGENTVRHFVLPLAHHTGRNLEKARDMARNYQNLLRQGINPRQAETQREDPTLGEMLRAYRRRQVQEHERAPDRLAFGTIRQTDELIGYLETARPGLLRTPASELRRGEIVRFLDDAQASMRREGTPTRNRLLRVLRAMLAWAREREYLTWAHEQELRSVKAQPTRSALRPLQPEQAGALARAFHDHDSVVADWLEFVFATGLRAGETRLMRAKHVDLDRGVITLPPDVRKTRFPHHVPITPWMRAILLRQRAVIEGDPDGIVFASPGQRRTPINPSQSQPRNRFTADAARTVAGLWADSGHPAWGPQVLRQTVATRMLACGVDEETRELCLGHGSAGIQRYYADPSAAYDRKLAALETWQAELARLAGLDAPAEAPASLDRAI